MASATQQREGLEGNQEPMLNVEKGSHKRSKKDLGDNVEEGVADVKDTALDTAVEAKIGFKQGQQEGEQFAGKLENRGDKSPIRKEDVKEKTREVATDAGEKYEGAKQQVRDYGERVEYGLEDVKETAAERKKGFKEGQQRGQKSPISKEDVKEKTRELAAGAGETFEGAKQLTKDVSSSMGEAYDSAKEGVKQKVNEQAPEAGENLQAAKEKAAEAGEQLQETKEGVMAKAGEAWDATKHSISLTGEGIIAAKDTVVKAAELAFAAVGAVTGAVGHGVGAVTEAVGHGVSSVTGAVTHRVMAAVGLEGETMKEGWVEQQEQEEENGDLAGEGNVEAEETGEFEGASEEKLGAKEKLERDLFKGDFKGEEGAGESKQEKPKLQQGNVESEGKQLEGKKADIEPAEKGKRDVELVRKMADINLEGKQQKKQPAAGLQKPKAVIDEASDSSSSSSSSSSETSTPSSAERKHKKLKSPIAAAPPGMSPKEEGLPIQKSLKEEKAAVKAEKPPKARKAQKAKSPPLTPGDNPEDIERLLKIQKDISTLEQEAIKREEHAVPLTAASVKGTAVPTGEWQEVGGGVKKEGKLSKKEKKAKKKEKGILPVEGEANIGSDAPESGSLKQEPGTF